MVHEEGSGYTDKEYFYATKININKISQQLLKVYTSISILKFV